MNRHPSHDLDRSVLARVRDRDPEAMNRFFEAFIDRVYGYVVTLVKNPALADDIVQDAFLRMHRALDGLDPERDPAPWVFTVVTNAVRDHWRSWAHRNRGRMVDVDELWDQPSADGDTGPVEELERKEARQEIRRALAMLSAADREIILLRTYEGLKTEEIARELNLSAEAVRQRHSRAVRRLGRVVHDLQDGDQVRS